MIAQASDRLPVIAGVGASLGCKPKAVRGGPGTDNPNLDEGAMSTTLDRVDAYRATMKAHGLTVRFGELDDVPATAAEIVDQRLTAVVVAPENYPEELVDELEGRGVRVPDDVSFLLLGQPHHGRPGGRRWSGFSIPREEMGARALVLLSRLVAESGSGRSDRKAARAARVPEDELHQLLECVDVDGETVAAPPPAARPSLQTSEHQSTRETEPA